MYFVFLHGFGLVITLSLFQKISHFSLYTPGNDLSITKLMIISLIDLLRLIV